MLWPGAPAETVDPGAVDELPRGGSAPFVPVDGGVHAGSFPEFDCDPPPVPVPLGGVVVEPVPLPLGGVVGPPTEPPGAVVALPPEDPDVPVAVGEPRDPSGDDAARGAVLSDLCTTWLWRRVAG